MSLSRLARLALLFAACGAIPTANAQSIARSDYRGWNATTLSNGVASVQVVPDIGGRVIQYNLGSFEYFWVNQSLTGKLPPKSGLAPDGSWLNYGGEKLWPAPQGWDNAEQWPGPPDVVLDGSPYRCERLEKNGRKASIRLTSGEDPRSGIQFSRDIQLFAHSSHVHFDATMTNIDTKPRRWGIWTNAQQNAAAREAAGKQGCYDKNIRVYCPINPKSKLPGGYCIMFGDADNPSFQLDANHGIMCVHYERRVGKIAMDSSAGWLATVHGTSGRVFVQRFKFDAGKEYPDNASVEIWLNGAGKFVAWGKENEFKDDPIATPPFIETELLSPFAALKPGERYTFPYDWYAATIGGDYPVIDCNDLGVVCVPLEAKLVDGRLALGGRLGVFHEAAASVVFLDAQNKPIASPAHRPWKVSPAAPLVFSPSDLLPPPPPGAEAVSLRLHGDGGVLLGQLARTTLRGEQTKLNIDRTKSPRLRLQVVRTLPEPVIGKNSPGAENIPGGFEGGNSVKVVIDGKPEYHFFAHSYPTLGWGRSQLDHWVSVDGQRFRHAGVLLQDSKEAATGMKHIYTAPIPFFHEKENRWHLSYGEFVIKDDWRSDAGTMWCAPSKVVGVEGINGPFDFTQRKTFVGRKILDKLPVSNSAPFQVKDGRWAVFVCPDGAVGKQSGQWPVMLGFAASPLGPFTASELLAPPMIEPTGYTENPMPIHVKGPRSGRDYWVAVFDFLAPEVTAFAPKNVFGFSWSEDGVHWPKEHGQLVNLDDGLTAGRRGWWSGAAAVRTPHQMIDEGNGTYTIFFTGGTTEDHFAGFRAVGMVSVRLVEE